MHCITELSGKVPVLKMAGGSAAASSEGRFSFSFFGGRSAVESGAMLAFVALVLMASVGSGTLLRDSYVRAMCGP